MMKNKIPGLLAVGLLMSPMVAGATIINGTYEFTATDFFDGPSPIDPVVGTFSITFDNSADISDSTGIVLTVSLRRQARPATKPFTLLASPSVVVRHCLAGISDSLRDKRLVASCHHLFQR